MKAILLLHKDSFDRIPFDTARFENMTLLTSDAGVVDYGVGACLVVKDANCVNKRYGRSDMVFDEGI